MQRFFAQDRLGEFGVFVVLLDRDIKNEMDIEFGSGKNVKRKTHAFLMLICFGILKEKEVIKCIALLQ